MNIDTAIFIISAVVAVFGATMMVFQRNAVASVLYLILSIVAQAVLYVQLGALFIGAILIIVYAGAILVLFLFVIMMLNLRGGEDLGKPSPPLSQIVKYSITLLIFAELVFVVRSAFFRDAGATGILTTATDQFGSVEGVATLLFTRYLYPFELASILLLAAIVGAVVMARRESRSEEDLPGEVQK